MPISLKSDCLVGPVTAVSFVADFLLAGIGPIAKVYSLNKTKEIKSTKILNSSNIHGFKEDCSGGNVAKLCAYGGKEISIFSFSLSSLPERVCHLTECVEFEDWIRDVCWLKPNNSEDAKQDSDFNQGVHNDDTEDCLAIALSHNSVVLWNWKLNNKLKHVHCEEKCILYSCHLIGNQWKSLVLAAGTVFNQIVLWALNPLENEDVRRKVIHRLTGHQGVIFSIEFCSSTNRICSVSDDRSVRIWLVRFDGNLKDWNSAAFEPLHVLYGHSARVWDVKFLSTEIISIGEDSTICIWNENGHIQQKLKGHQGKSIWSLAVNKTDRILATGGGDCSVRLWPLKSRAEKLSEITTTILQLPSPKKDDVALAADDFPRVVHFYDHDKLFIVTDQGVLWLYTLKSGDWKILLSDPAYRSYCIACPNILEGCIALANLCGDIKLVYLESDLTHKQTICDGKILSMEWLSPSHLLITGPNGKIVCSSVLAYKAKRQYLLTLQTLIQLKNVNSEPVLQPITDYILPHSRQRWVTAAICLSDEEMLICGDRGGSVHVYTPDKQEPMDSFIKVHGRTGVTSITYHRDHIYSCGRNGQYCQYSISNGTVHLLISTKVLKGFEWLARQIFTDYDHLVLGFHSNQFKVHSTNRHETVFCVACGGGHRSWDFSLADDKARFICIKTRDIVISEGVMDLRNMILKAPLHGREMTVVSHVFSQGVQNVLVTGSEDTMLELLEYRVGESIDEPLRSIAVLQGHLSNVRALAIVDSALHPIETVACHVQCKGDCVVQKTKHTNNTLDAAQIEKGGTQCHKNRSKLCKVVFSGGGRAQLRAWRIHSDKDINCDSQKNAADTSEYEEEHCCNHKYRHEHLSSHMLTSKGFRLKKKWRDSNPDVMPETRYMGMTAFSGHLTSHPFPLHIHFLAAACSDGLLRLFMFDEERRLFDVIGCGDFHEHCLLTVNHVIHHSASSCTVYIITTATDGLVAFWNITDLLSYVAHTHGYVPSNQSSSVDEQIVTDATHQSTSPIDLGRPVFHIKLHQSGINAVDIHRLNDNDYLICTGGDDNALNLVCLHILSEESLNQQIDIKWRFVNLSAHAAQITGVHIIDGKRVVTTSIDQRITIWNIVKETQEIGIEKSLIGNVADVAGMTCWKAEDAYHVAVCGVGLQIVSLHGIAE